MFFWANIVLGDDAWYYVNAFCFISIFSFPIVLLICNIVKDKEEARARRRRVAAAAAPSKPKPAPIDPLEPVDLVDAAPPHSPAQQAEGVILHTLHFVVALQSSEGGYEQRMRRVVNLLRVDTRRPQPLIDLSLAPDGGKACVLFQLLRFFKSLHNYTGAAHNTDAQQQIEAYVLPLGHKLLRSFDPATIDAATGNNALHELCGPLTLSKPDGWDYQLAELLIASGVSVHTRNHKGRTPLLEYCQASLLSFYVSLLDAGGFKLLLAHGSDLNAQDDEGNTLLHLLVQRRIAPDVEQLLGLDGFSRIDFHLVNSAGQRAVDLAAAISNSARYFDVQEPAKRIHNLLATQSALWNKHVRSMMHTCLDEVLPVTDLVELTLGYVDGSGLPFAPPPAAGEAE